MVRRGKTPWKYEPACLYSFGEKIGNFFYHLLSWFLPNRRNDSRACATSRFVVNKILQAFLNGIRTV